MSTATEPTSTPSEPTPDATSESAPNVTVSRDERTKAKVAAATSEMSAEVASANASVLEEKAPEETCPKCHSTTPWGEASWCTECGYYPGVTEICPESYQEQVCEDGTVEAQDEPPMIAPWIMQLIVFNTALVIASIAARYYFTYFDGSLRGLVGLIVLVTGFISLAVNHLRAAFAAMQTNVEFSPFDMVGSPIEMWRPTFRDLPKTAGRLIWATMGITAMICGGLVIGGIDMGGVFKHEPVKKKPDVLKKIVSSAVANAPPEEEQPETIEEALEQVATLEELGAIPMPEPGEPITCVVYGFLKDGKEDFGRILLAAEIGGTRRHVATMPASAFPKSSREILAARLQPLVVPQSSVETQYHATWVRPTIGLRIEFSGWSVLGEMNDPTLAPRAIKSEPAPLEPISP